jgi:hypothetical protein
MQTLQEKSKLKKVIIAASAIVILAILAALSTVKITHTYASSAECRVEIVG